MAASLGGVIKSIETALAVVRRRLKDEKLGITLQRADIELKVTTTGGISGGFKWDLVVPVEVGGKHETTDTMTIALSLTPAKSAASLGESPSDELADGIIELAKAMKQASDETAGNFAVSSGSIGLEFAVTAEGTLQIVVGPKINTGTTNSIELNFRPSIEGD
jgi:Trypsin-co-occurring domain 2